MGTWETEEAVKVAEDGFSSAHSCKKYCWKQENAGGFKVSKLVLSHRIPWGVPLSAQ